MWIFSITLFFYLKDINWLFSFFFLLIDDLEINNIYTGIDVNGRAAEILEIVKRYVRRVFLNCLFSKDSLSHSFFIRILSDLM